jgi:hypothetical protein
MKKLVLLTLLTLLLCGLVLVGPALAQTSTNYALTWHVIAGGSGVMNSPSYGIQGTAGQPTTGLSAGAQYDLCAGFWCNEAAQFSAYLPLIVRSGQTP